MLTLLLFRHAKAERGSASVPDEKRPLAERGRIAADQMGYRLRLAGVLPDLVLCSPATRALETLALASSHWAPAPRTSIVAALYEEMAGSYVEIVRGAPAARRLLLVAHNSATEETARAFVGEAVPDAGARLAGGFPTAAIAVIDFDASAWNEVREGQGRLTGFLTAD